MFLNGDCPQVTMFPKYPKSDSRIIWTRHAKQKMRQYQLSESRLRRLLVRPVRIEEGIAPGTIAIMATAGSKNRPTEVWLMYEKVDEKKKIITTWRYPGKSPVREVPIPEEEIANLKLA